MEFNRISYYFICGESKLVTTRKFVKEVNWLQYFDWELLVKFVMERLE